MLDLGGVVRTLRSFSGDVVIVEKPQIIASRNRKNQRKKAPATNETNTL